MNLTHMQTAIKDQQSTIIKQEEFKMINNDLLYYIPSGEFGKEGVLGLLKTHPEIRFVSLVGIDLAGNDTDEKVPIELFLKNYDDFFAGTAVQTDGSSVVLMNIATLNDARVDPAIFIGAFQP